MALLEESKKIVGKVKANLNMYKDFFGGYMKYKDKIKASDKWMQKYADVKGLQLNPHKMYLSQLKIWLAENEDIYGQRICPCFEKTGDTKTDRKLTCPCTYAAKDIENHGTCHCNLFGKKDLTAQEWKEQEARIMREYRIPLKKVNETTIDTRNVPIDETRNMDVPDPVHQLKQALNQMQGSFTMIVEREQSAQNMVGFCELKKITASYEKAKDAYVVNIRR